MYHSLDTKMCPCIFKSLIFLLQWTSGTSQTRYKVVKVKAWLKERKKRKEENDEFNILIK